LEVLHSEHGSTPSPTQLRPAWTAQEVLRRDERREGEQQECTHELEGWPALPEEELVCSTARSSALEPPPALRPGFTTHPLRKAKQMLISTTVRAAGLGILLSLLFASASCDSTAGGSAGMSQCCVEGEALIAQMPECCLGEKGACCDANPDGSLNACCEETESLRAQMSPCCLSALDDPDEAEGCCSEMGS